MKTSLVFNTVAINFIFGEGGLKLGFEIYWLKNERLQAGFGEFLQSIQLSQGFSARAEWNKIKMF